MNQIIPATVEHVEELASRVRRADLDELRAATEMDPLTALLMSFTLSVQCYTWICDGKVGAVFGIAPDPEAPGVGCPWMIGSEHIKLHGRWFLRQSRLFTKHYLTLFPLLENYVHPSNVESIRYLEWCGFQFGEPEPYGAKGELFLPFFQEL